MPLDDNRSIAGARSIYENMRGDPGYRRLRMPEFDCADRILVEAWVDIFDRALAMYKRQEAKDGKHSPR